MHIVQLQLRWFVGKSKPSNCKCACKNFMLLAVNAHTHHIPQMRMCVVAIGYLHACAFKCKVFIIGISNFSG